MAVDEYNTVLGSRVGLAQQKQGYGMDTFLLRVHQQQVAHQLARQ